MLEKLYLPMDEFLNRFLLEGIEGTKFCWLIGAGMSVTAGMPLAKGISRRIILLEHLGAMRLSGGLDSYPWMEGVEGKVPIYSHDSLSSFFSWYNNLEEAVHDRYLDEAISWLGETKEDFKGITVDEPTCYSRIFGNLLGNTDTHRRFLTQLNREVPGTNLAHLCLAGILKDYDKLGTAVFTTNFDDLLLKAILSLNHTARIFGELNSKDLPRWGETYPQIMHLHGRHTGYRLINTQKQIREVGLNNPELKNVFRDFLRQSHLIVLGYSGWDDLVTSTLAKWPEDDSIVGGTLYWVPFMGDENTIHPETRKFLKAAPADKVKLIVDKEEPLSADSFMLRFVDAIAKEEGGFAKYRQEFLGYAVQQHTTFIEHLREHPLFNPESALEAAKESVKACKSGDREAVGEALARAEAFGQMEDVHDRIRAETFHHLGIVHLYLRNSSRAEEYLNESVLLWDKLKGTEDDAEICKARTLRVLGELYLRAGDLGKAEKAIGRSRARFKNNKDLLGWAFANKLFADLELRRSKVPASRVAMEQALEQFQELYHQYGIAICRRGLGEVAILEGDPNAAKEHIRAALEIFERYGDTMGKANSLKDSGNIHIHLGDYPEAARFLEESRLLYESIGHTLGVGHVLQALADLKKRREDWGAAAALYEEALDIFEKLEARHAVANTLGDLLRCHHSAGDLNNRDLVGQRARDGSYASSHPYLAYILESLDLAQSDKGKGGH